MEMNYCRRCGTPLAHKTANVYICENNHTLFANASPCVGVFIFDTEGQLLTSVRGIEPHKGMLDSFGGFVDGAETLEDALTRELKEELQLDETMYDTPVFYTSGFDYYPYEGDTIITLTSFYYTTLNATAVLTPSDDVASIDYSTLHEIDLDSLHSDDVRHAITKLREIFPI